MRTPSLRNRVVTLGIVVVLVVLASVNAVLFVVFRAQLHQSLDEVLDERATLVASQATMYSGAELSSHLTALGIRAIVKGSDGTEYRAEPPSPALGGNLPPGPAVTPTSAAATRDVRLPDGSTVTVFARRTGVDRTQRNLLLLDGIGLVIATVLAGGLLHRTARIALRPLEEIAASARRTSAGKRGERLQPDRTDTSLGQLAGAYDEMLDNLEAAMTRANEAQTESELAYLHLRQVIETANAGFIGMNSDGTITEWNRQAEEIFGWTEKEALGRPLAETVVPETHRRAHIAGLQRFLDTGEHRVLGKTMEFDALHRDGHLVPVEIATWVTYIGEAVTFSALVRDITERRKGEQAIACLASIVESAQEAILSTSLDGEIVTWNHGAELLYGYAAEEAVGEHIALIVPANRVVEIDTVQEQVRAGKALGRYETVRRRKDGSDVAVAVTSSPIFDAWGAVVGASTIARDITEQREMAVALSETLKELERTLDDARRSDERSRQFLADAAHQLRSPIAGVRACAETLLLATGERDRDQLLADLVRETARAGRLISSLLRLARIDQGLPPEPEPCDIVALCEAQVERTRLRAPQLDVTLQVGNLPTPKLELDPSCVNEILANLLDNAVRHASTTVRVKVSVEAAQLHLVVADDGSGVADEAVGMIFHRFVSLDGKGGSGLGLPIARSLARGSGGDLTYDRTGFHLILPVAGRLDDGVRLHTHSR